MGSRLENFSDNQLRKYIKYVKQHINQSQYEQDIDDYYNDVTDKQTLRKLSAPFGTQLNRWDFEYIYYVLNENKEIENEDVSLDRPELDQIDIILNEYEKQWVTVSYHGDIQTYLPNNVNDYYLNRLREDGEFDPYDWHSESDVHDSDIDNSDWSIGV